MLKISETLEIDVNQQLGNRLITKNNYSNIEHTFWCLKIINLYADFSGIIYFRHQPLYTQMLSDTVLCTRQQD